ncbi:hypothetical protein H6790_02685 [Candidatus Nomurabacteria bacterium]|nr:hypothetical protein [Candidatus Nomurabacteria bacterium]MCB9820827.1 hypothetical protein [Candidatus Nomurabacteria bacterium]
MSFVSCSKKEKPIYTGYKGVETTMSGKEAKQSFEIYSDLSDRIKRISPSYIHVNENEIYLELISNIERYEKKGTYIDDMQLVTEAVKVRNQPPKVIVECTVCPSGVKQLTKNKQVLLLITNAVKDGYTVRVTYNPDREIIVSVKIYKTQLSQAGFFYSNIP